MGTVAVFVIGGGFPFLHLVETSLGKPLEAPRPPPGEALRYHRAPGLATSRAAWGGVPQPLFLLYVNVNVCHASVMATKTKKACWSIGELARELDITTRTIRYYEDMGLLSPERRGQARIYSPADRVRLKLILRGKRLGFSLEESRELIEMYSPDGANNRAQLNAVLDRIEARRAQLAQQLRDIQATRRELDEAEQRCRQAMSELES